KASAVVTPLPGTLELYLNFGMGFHTNQARIALLDGRSFVDRSGNRFTAHAVPRLYGGEVGARLRLWSRVDLAAALWASWLEDETSPEYRAFAATDPARVTAQAWFVVDSYAAYRFRFVELSLSAQNLLNSDWREAQLGNRSCTRAETQDPGNLHCGLGQPARD